MADDNIYDKFEHHEKEFTSRLRGFLMRNFPYIMLLANIVFEVLSRLFVIGFAQPFTPDFWSNLFINTCSSTLAYACFMIYADHNKRTNNPDYVNNLKVWSTTSANVRLHSFDDFLAFCKAQYAREVEDIQASIIANHTRLPLARWKTYYRTLSRRDLRGLVRSGEISRAEMRYIIKAGKHPRLKPIDPLLILAGIKANDINDAGRRTSSPMRSVLFRPVGFIAISLVVSMFAGRFIGFEDSSAFFNMLYTAGLIIGSSLVGYAKGSVNAEKKHNEIKGRIIFLERYAHEQELAEGDATKEDESPSDE